jgi:hypothetical protein
VAVLILLLFSLELGFARNDHAATVITFDVPGAGTGTSQGTFPTSIDVSGRIAGYYVDANFAGHGFLRALDGTITTFDPPGSSESDASSINLLGVVAGSYNDTRGHGYVRTPDGSFTTIDIPVTATSGYKGAASASDINLWGMVTGYYSDPNFGIHGYVWIPKYPCEKNDDHWKRRP